MTKREEELINESLHTMERFGIFDIESIFYFLEIDEEAFKLGLQNAPELVRKAKTIKAKRYVKKFNQLNERDDTKAILEAFKLVAPEKQRNIIMGNAGEADSNEEYLKELQKKTIKQLTKKRDEDK